MGGKSNRPGATASRVTITPSSPKKAICVVSCFVQRAAWPSRRSGQNLLLLWMVRPQCEARRQKVAIAQTCTSEASRGSLSNSSSISRRRASPAVEIGVHRRVVVHLELAVDLQAFAAGENIGEQFAERAVRWRCCSRKDRQAGRLWPDVRRRRRSGGFARPCDRDAGQESKGDR